VKLSKLTKVSLQTEVLNTCFQNRLFPDKKKAPAASQKARKQLEISRIAFPEQQNACGKSESGNKA